MKVTPNPQPEDALLDAMLRDELWQNADAALKTEALKAFRIGRRIRRIRRWAGGVAVIAVLTAAALHFSQDSPLGPRPSRIALVPPSLPPAPPSNPRRTLSDQELLAAFPKGSCFIAEIDGEKQLVFVNPGLERVYVSRPADDQH